MTCGYLGCGRSNFDGTGGKGHAVAHSAATDHPVVCKLGTVTAEGTADIFCYACDDSKKDPFLEQHFAHFGIRIDRCKKTEATTSEITLKMNQEFNFSSVDESDLGEPVYGPGFTGMNNIGNSCYLASVVQNLFNLPAFSARYQQLVEGHSRCTADPTSCFLCQMAKLADGLLSGRFSRPGKLPGSQDQVGIAPTSFKHFFASNLSLWKGTEQQDAEEYFQHLMEHLERFERPLGPGDPTASLRFGLEQRVQCRTCGHVGYRLEKTTQLSVNFPPAPPADPVVPEGESPLMARVNHERGIFTPLPACLARTFAAEEVPNFSCPVCQHPTVALKSHGLSSAPQHLAVVVRRQQFETWVPVKVHRSLSECDPLSLASFVSQRTPGETLFPEGSSSSSAAGSAQEFDQATLSALTAMEFSENRAKRAMLSSPAAARDPNVAMEWLFSNMDDPSLDDPLPSGNANEGAAAGGVPGQFNNEVLTSLVEMGFGINRAKRAMQSSDAAAGDAMIALDWLTNFMDDPSLDEPFDDIPATSPLKPASSSANSPDESSLEQVRTSLYSLSGFIEHRGNSIHSGHYVAYLKKNGTWYQFNDSRVRECSKPPIHQAYMLFFSRV